MEEPTRILLLEVGKGKGDIERTIAQLKDEKTQAMIAASHDQNEFVRDGLAICFLYHRPLTAEDDPYASEGETVIDEEFYPLIDAYGFDYPMLAHDEIAIINCIVDYANRTGKVDQAKIVRDIYESWPGYGKTVEQAFGKLPQKDEPVKDATRA